MVTYLFIFASAAAVGAGLAVEIDHALHHAEIGDVASGATVAVPVAIYLIVIWVLHAPQNIPPRQRYFLPVTTLLILLTPFSGQAPLGTGILLVTLLTLKLVMRYRKGVS